MNWIALQNFIKMSFHIYVFKGSIKKKFGIMSGISNFIICIFSFCSQVKTRCFCMQIHSMQSFYELNGLFTNWTGFFNAHDRLFRNLTGLFTNWTQNFKKTVLKKTGPVLKNPGPVCKKTAFSEF